MLGVVLKKREPPNPKSDLARRAERCCIRVLAKWTACCRLWMDRCKVLEASKPLNLCSWPSRPECIYQSAGLCFFGLWRVLGAAAFLRIHIGKPSVADIRHLQPPCWQGMEAFPGGAPNRQSLKGLPSTKLENHGVGNQAGSSQACRLEQILPNR